MNEPLDAAAGSVPEQHLGPVAAVAHDAAAEAHGGNGTAVPTNGAAVPLNGAAVAPAPRASKRVRVECGDLPFLVKRDGTWLYRGTPINRKELVCLFSSVLRRDAEGSYWLETPAERGRIQVEDTPWLAVELDWTGAGRDQVLSLRTNVDQVVTVGPDHPIRVAHDLLTAEPTPYVTIRHDPGTPPLEARIGRAVYYELVALAVPETHGGRRMLGVWSERRFFPLGELPLGEEATGGEGGDAAPARRDA